MKNLTKSEFQKKFRFIIMIAAAVLFLALVMPAYWQYKDSGMPNKAIMMWTVVFGGTGKVGRNFGFSWLGFTPFILSFLVIVIWCARKFLVVDISEKGKNASEVVLDTIYLVLSVVMLVLFIMLPISLANATNPNIVHYINDAYGFSVACIFAYVVCAVMIVSSIMILYADVIVKLMNRKTKKVK